MLKHLLIAVSFVSLTATVQQSAAAGSQAVTAAGSIEKSGLCKGLDLSVTPDMLECSDIRFKAADKQLNEVYKQLMGQLDADRKSVLKTEQRRWLKDLDKKCAEAGKEFEGGQMEGITIAECQVEMTEQRVAYLKNYNQKKGDPVAASPVSATTRPNEVISTATGNSVAASDNPAIESWVKACTPFTAPTKLEKQIPDGKVTFRGIKVAAVDAADGGASSLVSLRLAISSADLKSRYPEFGKKIKFPKNKACPMGIERSLADQSFTGVKGATIECNCFTGGD